VPEPERPAASLHGTLDGQVALVTGASSGLGRATALAMAQAGADVAVLARGKQDLEQVEAEVGLGGPGAARCCLGPTWPARRS
jgi:NAD(P)-dependent dehydrogenase (short-subunit alcohol dehydrogenase family)